MAFPVRLRHPRGVSTISVEGSTTLEDLQKLIFGQSELTPDEQDLKYGYPPKPFPAGITSESPISSVPITRGEQITVTQNASAAGRSGASNASAAPPKPAAPVASNIPATAKAPVETQRTKLAQPPRGPIPKSAPNPGPAPKGTPPTPSAQASLDADAAFAASLQREYDKSFSSPAASNPTLSTSSKPPSASKEEETVELPLGAGIMQHRLVPDDNSCLFSSVAIVFLGGTLGDKVVKELRVVADTIRKNPFEYSDAILGRPRQEYIDTILKPNSWGGAIELSIFSKHFSTEIDSFDVQSGRADKFGEGEYGSRCILVYSGIHYDAITTAPIPSAPPEFHTSIFPTSDTSILLTASKLVAQLKEKRYFTDVANFDLRCGVCKVGLKGEKGAREHAMATGHVEFGEY